MLRTHATATVRATVQAPVNGPVQPDEPIDEAALVTRAAAGDRAAFRALYDASLPRIRRQVARLMGPPGADVDDVVQEVYVQVHRALPRFRADSRVSTWMHRIAHNVACSALRKRRPVVDLATVRQFDLAPDAWRRLEARDLTRLLYSALDEVNDSAREAFVLYHLEGHTLDQIASLEGVSIHTIAARVRRTREKVVDVLTRASRSPSGGRS